MNRLDLQVLAEMRIAEAVGLLTLAPPKPDGAYYLAGYAIECALKACIAKLINQHDYPDKQLANDCFTHNIETLVRIAGLETARKSEADANPVFAKNWSTVKDWNERSRYGLHSQAKTQKMIDAITDSMNGVLPWIKARW